MVPILHILAFLDFTNFPKPWLSIYRLNIKVHSSLFIDLKQWFLTFLAPWTPKSKTKVPWTPKLSITTTWGPLNHYKIGVNGYITLLLWSSRTPQALSTDPLGICGPPVKNLWSKRMNQSWTWKRKNDFFLQINSKEKYLLLIYHHRYRGRCYKEIYS